MKDIKSLYITAKNTMRDKDLTAYQEAVNELFEYYPVDYIRNIEYIIKNSNTLNTFKEFVSTYGLAIPCYNYIMEAVDNCIETCKEKKVDAKAYNELHDWLTSYHDKYKPCFDMYEYYAHDVDEYVETYYGENSKGKQNAKLVPGMIDKFGEMAIPDLIIRADQSGEVGKLLKYVYTEKSQGKLKFDHRLDNEWIYNTFKPYTESPLLDEIKLDTASYVVDEMHRDSQQVLRESVITGEEPVYEYSDDEIEAIQDLISYKEFALLDMDDPKLMRETQNEIYSLYSELPDYMFESSKLKEYKPIYGVVKSYSEGKLKNDGTPKTKGELHSTMFKHQIKALTRGDNYSHALISFNDDLTEMYSFDDEGMVTDNINTEDSWMATESVYICAMFLNKDDWNKMHEYCKDMIKHKDQTKYAFANLIRAYVGKPVKQDKRFICSTFTAYILQASNPKNLHRDYSRLRPEDITILPRAFYVMNVRDRNDFNKKKGEFKKRVKAIQKEHIEEINDYNNDLPKIMLQDKMKELKTSDKILDWIVDHVFA